MHCSPGVSSERMTVHGSWQLNILLASNHAHFIFDLQSPGRYLSALPACLKLNTAIIKAMRMLNMS